MTTYCVLRKNVYWIMVRYSHTRGRGCRSFRMIILHICRQKQNHGYGVTLIGIKAAYKNIIFETRVAPPKGTKGKPEKPREEKAKAPVNYGKHKTEPFVPKDGLPWRPGLESYRECKEIVEDIFFKPYSNKRPKGPGKERRSA